MPVYEYYCEECGPFARYRSLADSSQPYDCPECGGASARVFSAVNLRSMSAGHRMAWERNERSAQAPHVCGAGCSHGPARPKASATTAPGGDRPALQTSGKEHSRPWMLGH